MKIHQFHIRHAPAAKPCAERDAAVAAGADLVLVFGAVADLEDEGLIPGLRADFPQARLVGCSTAGQISAAGVTDGSVAVTAIRFTRPSFRVAVAALDGAGDSRAAGERLARELASADLRDIVVFGQGVGINGSALIEGIAAVAGPAVSISGGLAGDGSSFSRTVVLTDDGASSRHIVGIGFHGDGMRIGHGSFGGWQPFGPARRVTRCAGNVLHELDGAPALDVYKRYLGDHARDLPASGLLFPFSMLGSDHNATGLIRTILGIDEAAGSLTLAGEIDADGYLQLMHASSDALIDGAESAAMLARDDFDADGDALSLLVSCVGRRLVLGDRIDEEVEAVAEVFEQRDVVAGFYSYGEISPFLPSPECKLHNQTMTISRWREAA